MSSGKDLPPEIALEYLAMNIVHQIGDALYEALPKDIAHEYFVDARQKTNDTTIDFAKKLISEDRQKMIEYVLGEPKQVLIQVDNQEFLNGGYANVSDQWQRAQEWISHETL
jgi:hypothetical protein